MIRVKLKSWAIEWWTDTSVLYVKLCQSWDGTFIVDNGKPALPLFGFRRELYEHLLENEERRTRTRVMRGWRLWFPYVMFWYLNNEVDRIVITIDEDSTAH